MAEKRKMGKRAQDNGEKKKSDEKKKLWIEGRKVQVRDRYAGHLVWIFLGKGI